MAADAAALAAGIGGGHVATGRFREGSETAYERREAALAEGTAALQARLQQAEREVRDLPMISPMIST